MTTFGARFNFRKGDVVRFARGGNEYVGEITKVSSGMSALTVVPEDQPKPGTKWRIGHRHVLALEKPVVTETERDALLVLFERGALTVAEAKKVSLPLTGRTLHNLRERGLVLDYREGVARRDAATWQLTPEGESAARALHEEQKALDEGSLPTRLMGEVAADGDDETA